MQATIYTQTHVMSHIQATIDTDTCRDTFRQQYIQTQTHVMTHIQATIYTDTDSCHDTHAGNDGHRHRLMS